MKKISLNDVHSKMEKMLFSSSILTISLLLLRKNAFYPIVYPMKLSDVFFQKIILDYFLSIVIC